MNKIYMLGIIALFSLMIILSPTTVVAQVNGAETYDIGALPPPGFHLLDYTNIYNASQLNDNSGHRVNVPFNVTAVAQVIRPLYVADVKVFGANPAWQLVIPIIYEHERVGSATQSKTGLGDMYMSPIYLGWHSEIFHWVAGMDAIAPTGAYHSGDLVNIGSNRWTFEPVFAISAITKQGFSANAKFMYDIHTINPDGDYQTGDIFHVDYTLTYKINDTWSAGFGGYWWKELQNDSQNHVELPGTIQQVLGMGPNVEFHVNKQFFMILQPDFEFDAHNMPQGINTWFKMVYSF